MWVLVAMVRLQDPNSYGISPAWAASYIETAEEIAEAATEAPLSNDRRRTAALLVVMAYRESRFNRLALGDGGASVGLFQINRGWGVASARGALSLIHASFDMCRERPFAERLGWYMWGRSGCDHRLEKSAARMHEAARLAKELPTF